MTGDAHLVHRLALAPFRYNRAFALRAAFSRMHRVVQGHAVGTTDLRHPAPFTPSSIIYL